MRLREIGWGLFLAGLPWAHFLFRPYLDLWYSQAAWSQAWVLILIAGWLWQGGRPSVSPALAGWLSWISLSWLWAWNAVIIQQKILPLGMTVGLLHLLVVVGFYLAATATWTRTSLQTIFRWMAYSTVILVAYCGLQAINLDQFFQALDPALVKGDTVVGTIGNPSHLAAHLALLLPIILWQPRWGWKILAGLMGIIIVLSNSQVGIIATGIVMIVWLISTHRPRLALLLGCVGLLSLLLTVWKFPFIINPHGRWAAWATFWTIFAQRPITGFGPGFVMEFSKTIPQGSPIYQWRHCHQEFLQIAIEQGLIGLSFVSWFLVETFQQTKRALRFPEGWVCLTMLITFLFMACFNFVAHLWLTGSLGLLSICGIRVLAREELA